MNVTQAQWNAIMEQWHAVNEAGEGYGIGEEQQAPEAAVEEAGWTVLARHEEGAVLAEKPDGTRVMVCDANGPWCVDVTMP